MITLYRPVLIESAEQAEALPDGSIVIDDTGDRYNRVPRTGWHSAIGDRDLTEDLDSTFMPPTITALVPIEAEERWQDGSKTVWNLGEGEATAADVDDYERRNGSRPLRRLVTPWEESR